MSTVRKSIAVAVFSLVALAGLAVTPAPARAWSCDAEYMACLTRDLSTRCIHEYARCIAEMLIREY